MFKQTGPWRLPLFSSMVVAGLWLLWKGAPARGEKPADGSASTPAKPARLEEAPVRGRLPGLSILLPWAAYLGIIAAAELSMAGHPWVALALYAYLLFFLLAHSLLFRPAEMPLAAALALAPATRILGVLAGAAGPDLLSWYLLTGVSLVAVGALVAGCLGLPRKKLGLTPGRLGHQLAVGLLGLPLAVAGYLLLRPSPLGAGMSGVEFWALALLLLLATGPVEEFLFRGVVQSTALPVMGRWGLVYASGLFALLQAAAGGPVHGLYWFLVGLAFSWLVVRTGSLLGVGLAHGLASAGIYLVIPLLLAGSPLGGTTAGMMGLPAVGPASSAGGAGSLLASQVPLALPGVARPGPSLGGDVPDWAGRLAGRRLGPRTGAIAQSGAAVVATPSADQRAVLGATPVPAPTSAGTTRPDTESYTVQPGDGLFGIAESHGTTVEALMALNGLTDRSFIRSGQTLLLPARPGTPSPSAAPSPTANPPAAPGPSKTVTSAPSTTPTRAATSTATPSPRVTATPAATMTPRPAATPSTATISAGWERYRVKAGDSLFGIAMSRNTTVEELMSRNGLTDRASITSGQEILVPASPTSR